MADDYELTVGHNPTRFQIQIAFKLKSADADVAYSIILRVQSFAIFDQAFRLISQRLIVWH